MSEIAKAGFYRSWFEFAQRLPATEQAEFYNMVFAYYFDGIEPDENESLYNWFILLKPSIDKDIDNRTRGAGAPIGNSNAKKTKTINENNCQNNCQNNYQNNSKTNKVKVKDKEKVNVKVKEEITEETSETELNTYSFFKNNLAAYFPEFGNKLFEKTKIDIFNRLESTGQDFNFLLFCLEQIQTKYPDEDDITALWVDAVLQWDNLLQDYKRTIPKSKKKKTIIPAPRVCSFCGGELESGGIMNSVECPNCREQGTRTWWELINNEWVCNR